HRTVARGTPRPPTLQPADHRAVDTVHLHRARRRVDLAAHRRGSERPHGDRHAEQLRWRRHALGHRALRRGELQPVLCRRRRGARRAQTAVRPLRHQHLNPLSPRDSRKWDRADERFDLAKHPNTAHRFGWVVEIDPYNPASRPRKHTALGRFKHEGATVTVAKDGRVVAYMGDDERFDYLYKFVS